MDCERDTRASHTCSHMQNIKVNLGIYMLQFCQADIVLDGSGRVRDASGSHQFSRLTVLEDLDRQSCFFNTTYQTWCSTPCHFFMYCVIHLSRTLDKFYILYV